MPKVGPHDCVKAKASIPSHDGRSARSWLRDLVLGGEDESQFEAAQRAFAAMGKAAVPWLSEEFEKETLTEARAAKLAQALRAIGPEAASALPLLLGRIEEYPDSITYALSGFGDKATPVFIQIFRHPNRHVRMRACEQLASAVQFGGLDREPFLGLIPELLQLLEHDWHMLRWRAAMLLGALCTAPDRCIPALTRLLDDPHSGVQGAAATALGFYGDQASVALPRLLVLSKVEDQPLRSLVISALGYFSDEKVFPVLVQALKDPAVSTAAIYSLVRGGWPSEQLVPVLCECIRSGTDVTRWAAAEHLGSIGQQAQAAVPVLKAAMISAHSALRDLIATSLWQIEGADTNA